MTQTTSPKLFAYVGTYTKTEPHVAGKAEGIYVYQVDLSTGALTYVSVARGMVNPSFLTVEPQKRYLYAVSETNEVDGQPGGAVYAYAIDPATGNLTYLNHQNSQGVWPCSVSVDATSQWVLVANYTSGSIAAYPILDDGRVGPASDHVQHQGSSVNPRRQEGPHAHMITLDPSNHYVIVPDLGMDKVMIYAFDLVNGTFTPNTPPSVSVPPGYGPRHFDFHPNRKFAYLINEIGNHVTAYAYDEASGTLTELQTVPTLPADFTGTSHTADIHVHPSGKFVYGSNRGHNSIAIFSVDQSTGKLTPVGHESTQGRTPRNFAISADGTMLFAENQDTDTIVAFQIDQATGKLTPTGQVNQVPTPVCMKLVALG